MNPYASMEAVAEQERRRAVREHGSGGGEIRALLNKDKDAGTTGDHQHQHQRRGKSRMGLGAGKQAGAKK